MAKEKKEGTGKEVSRVERMPRMMSPFEEMDRLMENFFPEGWMRPFRWPSPAMAGRLQERMPLVDVIERDEEIVMRAELPGIKKEDIDISVTDNSVSISATRAEEKEEEHGEYYRREISRGTVSRTVALPANIDSEKAEATFKEGVLELKLPKVERSKRRSIEVH